jgi:hypothetical protein
VTFYKDHGVIWTMILFYVSVAVISTSTPLTCFHGAVVWKPRRSLAAHTEPAGRPDLQKGIVPVVWTDIVSVLAIDYLI